MLYSRRRNVKKTNKTREWLVNARKNEKISLLALSKKIGLAYPSAYKIENGKTLNIKPETIGIFAEALNISLEEAVEMENEYKREIEKETGEKLKKLVLLDPSEVKNDIFSANGKNYKVDFPVNEGKVLLNLERIEK